MAKSKAVWIYQCHQHALCLSVNPLSTFLIFRILTAWCWKDCIPSDYSTFLLDRSHTLFIRHRSQILQQCIGLSMLNGPYILLSCSLQCAGKHSPASHGPQSPKTWTEKGWAMHCKFCTLNVIPTHGMSTGKAVIQRTKGKWQSTVGRSLLIRFFIVTQLELRPSYTATTVLLRIVLCFIILDKAVFLNSWNLSTHQHLSWYSDLTPTPKSDWVVLLCDIVCYHFRTL